MHLVDLTMFFSPNSGGIKRYLFAKRDWLMTYTDLWHHILVPRGSAAENEKQLVFVPGFSLTLKAGYRIPLQLNTWHAEILSLQPNLIEVADAYQLAWVGLRAAKKLRIPAIAFCHSNLVSLAKIWMGSWCERPVKKYVRNLYQRFDLVLAPSRVMQVKLFNLGIEHAVWQPLGVDIRLFEPGRRDPSLRKELNLSEDVRLLIYAGRFAKEKNLPVLISALHKLGSKYHLLLVGAGEKIKSEKNITVYPYCFGVSLARLIASCDAFVHAGDQETFGLAALEAMACGLPVVAVRAGAMAELVDDEVGILVQPNNVDEFAQGVQALFEKDLTRMRGICRKRIEDHYAWNRVFPTLLGHYSKVLGRKITSTHAIN